jgi:hypothetical protein
LLTIPRCCVENPDSYGIDTPETNDFGRQLLLARRLAERGVRFIQVCHAGAGKPPLGRA